MKRTGITRYLTLSLAALMSVNLAACGSAGTTTDTTSTKAEKEEAQSQTEDIQNAITKVVGNGEEGGADKEETVYVFTDANGNTKNITVSNWLKNVSGNSVIKDSSTLSDIENVEGDEKHTKKGDEITWHADGNDIYYQGKTDKKPPVSQQITYYLDGKAVDPKDLAGKSGHIKIHIDFTNTEKYNDVYVPFTAVTGIALDNKNVKNVKVDHGSIVSEGKHTVVVGLAFPGLQDSLQSIRDDTQNMLDEVSANQKARDKVNDLDIPSSVEIEMDATDFQMSTALTMVFSNLLTKDNSGIDDDEVNEDHDDALDEMDDKVNELTDDGDKLADGATELSDGIKTANDNMPDLTDGTKQLTDGVKQYTDGVAQVDDGVSTLKDGTSQLAANSSSLKSGANQLDSGISTLKSGTDQLTSNSASLVSGANQLAEGTQKFMAYVNAIGNDGGKSLQDQVGKQAQSELLNSDEYKSGKQQMLGQVNGMTSQFDSSKKFVNAYFDIAYKAATGQTMSADEQKSYESVKDNAQFKQLVSSIQKSAPQVTAAVTNALTANQDELKKLGTEEVTKTLSSEEGQTKINNAVTEAISANSAEMKQAVKGITQEGTDQNKIMQQAITAALSDETEIAKEVNTEVTNALQSDASQQAITDAVKKSLTDNKDQISNAVTTAMNTEDAQNAITKSVTEALKSAMTDPKNADPKSGTISASVNQVIASDVAEIQKTVAGSIDQKQVTSDVQNAMVSNADIQNLEKEMKTLQDQIATLQTQIAKMPAEEQAQMATLLSPLTQSLQNITATVNSAKTSIAKSVGDAVTQSVQQQMKTAGSQMTDEITKTVQDATKAAVNKTTEIAGSTAGAASASVAANIAGTAAATAAANLAATAAAPVVANVAVSTALGKGLAPKVAKAVGEASGTAIAEVAATSAAKIAATAAASTAASMTSDALQQSVVPKVAELAGGAAAMTTGKNTMNETIDSVQTTMQKQIGGMDLSATIDQMSGKIAYNVGSGVVKEALAKVVGSSDAGQAQGGLTQLNDGAHQLASGIKSYTDGVSQVAAGASQLKNGSSQLASGISTYTDGVDQVNAGADALKSGTSQLVANSGTLVSGTETLSEGAQKLADGMAELLSGSVELKDGVVKFNDEGIKKLADLYNTDVKSLDDKVQELKDAAKSYKTFTGAASDEDSTVKFIYKMDSIETDDDKD